MYENFENLGSEAGNVLNLFLFLANFQPQCSYKIVLIKRKECFDHIQQIRLHSTFNGLFILETKLWP